LQSWTQQQLLHEIAWDNRMSATPEGRQTEAATHLASAAEGLYHEFAKELAIRPTSIFQCSGFKSSRYTVGGL
jgi:hypothetical protein